jgi:hypothetical protein
MVIFLAVFLSLAGSDSRAQRTITVSVVTGRDRITFDTARVSEKEVRRWMRLSPNISNSNNFLVPESLQLCIEGHPEYRECGTRDWRAKNFIYNANVNLRKIRERIVKELDQASYPPELRRVVSYLKTIQEDDLFFQSQLLKFIQDWRTENLVASFGGIDSGQQCSAEIGEIRTAPDKQTAYKLAYFAWWNCANRALRAKVGEYPEAEWKEFLHRYSIREEFIEEDVD